MIQLELFPREISPQLLPTNLTTGHHRIHKWFNFIAGFSPEFVRDCIHDAFLQHRDVLIDPFAGLSTSLVQANFEGIYSIGFETNPFFFDISQAKIAPPETSAAIDQIEESLSIISPYMGNLLDVWSENAVQFLHKLVPEEKLRYLVQALWLEEQLNPSHRQIYRLIVSRVLELTSKSQTDGIYKAPTTKKKSMPYHEALKVVCAEIRQDITLTDGLYQQRATLYPTSSENMAPIADQSCSICVTSPPYLNNFDFAEMTRMELYFWRYAQSWLEITQKVRKHQIVNSTTAPTELKKKHLNFKQTLSPQIQAILEPLVETLQEKRALHAGKKDYYSLIYPYFSQMQSVIRELRRVLKVGSPFHLLVANSALYGVHIDTQNFLAQLMSENGFQNIKIEHLRKRGERWLLMKRQGSPQGLGEYHIFAKRI